MIKIGARLQLEIFQHGKMERYRCKLIEQSRDVIYVDYPVNMTTGRTEIFEIGTEFLASFSAFDGAIYQFPTELIAKKNMKVPALAIGCPVKEKLKRIQRREYVRIETSVDIAVHSSNKSFSPFTSVTYDLSGGGASLFLPPQQTIQGKEKLDVWMVLPMNSGGYEYIYTEATSVRFTKRESEKRNMLSIKFDHIEEKSKQLVIRYCFECQLRERRKNSS